MTDSDLIQIILMGLLVVITGIYAWRTFAISNATKKQADASMKMAEEMEEQTNTLRETVRMSIRPSVSVEVINIKGGDNYLFEPPTELYVELQNTGKGPARNVVVTCEGQAKRVEYTKIELPSLNVGDKRRYSIHRKTAISGNDLKTPYVLIKALYNDELGEIYSFSLEIDRNGGWKPGEIIVERGWREEND